MKINTHEDLEVFKIAFQTALEIYEQTKFFPRVENYALCDQIRRSSRSVCANLAEAFRKRYYPKMFIAKIIECEAAETQVWIKFSASHEYINAKKAEELYNIYEMIIKKLVVMRNNSDKWSFN